MRRLGFSDIAVLLVVAAAFLYGFRGVPSSQPYLYDESDYMNAGERGFSANYFETPTDSFFGFLDVGLHRKGLNQRASLSDYARGSRDIDFYRHFHGPMYYYYIAAVSPLVHGNEYWMRFAGFGFHLASFFLIALGVFRLTGDRCAALVASFLYLFSQASIATSATIASHTAYVFFTTLTLLLFASYLRSGSLRAWYWAVIAFTGAFCSIDYAILLLITFAICLFVFRNQRRLPARVVVRSVFLFSALLLVLWPFGILKLTALKGYVYIAYLAMQRKGSYGDFGPLTVWWQRFIAAPVEYSLDLIALIGVIALWRTESVRKYRAILLPCLVYAFFMLLTTLKNTSLNPTYVSSILPPLAIVTGTAVAAISSRASYGIRFAATASMMAATMLGGYALVSRQASDPTAPGPDAQLIASLRQSGMERSSLIVPYEVLPTLSYYFPQMILHSYLAADSGKEIQAKVRDYDAAGVVYRPRGSDGLPEILREVGLLQERAVGDSEHTVIYQFHGRS